MYCDWNGVTCKVASVRSTLPEAVSGQYRSETNTHNYIRENRSRSVIQYTVNTIMTMTTTTKCTQQQRFYRRWLWDSGDLDTEKGTGEAINYVISQPWAVSILFINERASAAAAAADVLATAASAAVKGTQSMRSRRCDRSEIELPRVERTSSRAKTRPMQEEKNRMLSLVSRNDAKNRRSRD